MTLIETVNKINDLLNDTGVDKKFLLSLYAGLFKKINNFDGNDFKHILSVSDKLLDFFLSKHDYQAVFNIYKIEHDYFKKQFQDCEVEKLNRILKETDISEKGIKKILDYLLISFDVINNRWFDIFNTINKISDKNNIPELSELLEKRMKPLLYKGNFHFIHTVHFVKHNYTELEKVYQKINDLSLIDSLTGLKNRRFFFITYENIFFVANRRKMSICFVMLDIDNFKQINDIYGHQKGDEVLIKIALTISNFFRRSDTIIRYGGDEILIMLTDAKAYDVKNLISQLLKKISQIPFKCENDTFHVTMSAGIYCKKIENCIKPALLKSKMLKKADEAMYKSKKEGKNKVTIYEDN